MIDHQHPSLIETTSEPASAVFDSMSSSVIKLTGGRALYLKEINRHLALICILREEALTKQALIDYNVRQLKKSIIKLFRLNQHMSRPHVSSSNIVQ
jgi:Ras-related GTP-binding protein C/D